MATYARGLTSQAVNLTHTTHWSECLMYYVANACSNRNLCNWRVYYEYLWFQTTKDPSSGHEDWTKRVVTRMGHYEMVPTLVKQMREVRRDNNLPFEMMVGTTSDLLKYNLRDVVRKSAARRAIEKAFRIPHYEVPGIYNRMELAFIAGETRRSSEIDESEGDTNSTISTQGGMEDPALNFIGELPHSDHDKPENVFRSRDLLITYYRNPTTIGEVEANISPPYKYPQVAVVEIDHNPRLIVRTEESLFGEIFLCSLSRNGSHSNFDSFPHSDSSKFLRKAVPHTNVCTV